MNKWEKAGLIFVVIWALGMMLCASAIITHNTLVEIGVIRHEVDACLQVL